RKRFGQHFLHDPKVIARIVDAVAPVPGQHVVEIGPGLGAITLPLLARAHELDVIEIDRDAIAELRTKTAGLGIVRIHSADALQFDLSVLSRGAHSLRVVGNLPYNISTPLLFRLIEYREHIADMHFMLQKEVVDRMAAAPGDDAYGRLTVMLAPWVCVEPLFDIGPGAFRPPPRVTSTFFRLTLPPEAPFVLDHPAAYARVVSAAFAQRRKTLRNALKNLLSADDIASCDIDPGLRAEVIAPKQYAQLAVKFQGKTS
ncbi:MAG: 16S rRNA (adenine(1518)-N(6)/adenine(1519)-N(6))-dimethyltransferase RsmA, partial [Candidatus Obscuribacterales bacterium]|nr:16S rRNA (adenine(1518)-N(6)/adenine(1519)-N(6))-dimethyltransferase RsmA [Steroidobacteraceae bacterium]